SVERHAFLDEFPRLRWGWSRYSRDLVLRGVQLARGRLHRRQWEQAHALPAFILLAELRNVPGTRACHYCFVEQSCPIHECGCQFCGDRLMLPNRFEIEARPKLGTYLGEHVCHHVRAIRLNASL